VRVQSAYVATGGEPNTNRSLVTHIRCVITDLAITLKHRYTQPRVATVHLPQKWPSFVIVLLHAQSSFSADFKKN
jgi:hypothetical protein